MKPLIRKSAFLLLLTFLGYSEIQAQYNFNYKNMETQFIETPNGNIAYRSFGNGSPIVLCNRFRGTIDTWDPLFINSLADKYQVIIFDYPEIGYSTGKFPDDIKGLADNLKVLIKSLGFNKVALGGWSFGGYVAQHLALENPELISHLILIGTNPPGENQLGFEPAFLERALIPVNSLEDEQVLFFEPTSSFSIKTSEASHARIYQNIDVSKIPSEQQVFNYYFKAGNSFKEDTGNLRDKLKSSDLPILILHGDHDVSFPIENWFVYLRNLKYGQLIIYTKAGHGPQHQFPELSARYISEFISSTQKL